MIHNEVTAYWDIDRRLIMCWNLQQDLVAFVAHYWELVPYLFLDNIGAVFRYR